LRKHRFIHTPICTKPKEAHGARVQFIYDAGETPAPHSATFNAIKMCNFFIVNQTLHILHEIATDVSNIFIGTPKNPKSTQKIGRTEAILEQNRTRAFTIKKYTFL